MTNRNEPESFRLLARRLLAGMLTLASIATADAQTVAPFPPRLSPGSGTGPVNGGRVHAITVHPRDNRRIVVASEFGGMYRSSDGGYNWRHLTSINTTFVTDVAYADGGGVLVATISRDTTIDPATGRGGVWMSRDDGNTWTQVNIVPDTGVGFGPTRPSGYGIAVALHDGRIVVAGTDYGVVLSTDGGATWRASALPSGGAVTSVLPLSEGRVLATAESGVWLRRSDGVWTRLRSGNATTAGVHALAPWPGRSDGALFLDHSSGASLRTYDATRNVWNSAILPPSGGAGRAPFVRVGMDPEVPGARVIWLGVPPNLLRASRTTFESVAALEPENWVYADHGSHADPGDMGLDADLRPVLYGNDGGLFRPTNLSGTRWTIATSPEVLNSLQITSLAGTHTTFPGGTSLYFATQDNGIWASPDSGLTWEWRDCEGSGISTLPNAPAPAASTVAYWQVGCNHSGLRIAEGNLINARNLSDRAGGTRLSEPGSAVAIGHRTWIRIAASRDGSLHNVYTSDDNGENWRLRALVPFASRGTIKVAHTRDTDVAYISYKLDPAGDPWANGIGLLRIERPMDRTVDWVTATSPQLLRLPRNGSLGTAPTMFDWRTVFAVNPADPNHIIAPDVVNNTIWVTRNGGAEWHADEALLNEVTRGGTLTLYDGHPYRTLITHIEFDAASTNRILVGTRDAGIIYSTDRGDSWRRAPGSERIRYITGFMPQRDSRRVIVSSYGNGLWRFDPGTVRAPFLYERMCFGIGCIVRLPPDASQIQQPLDWKRLDVVAVASGRVVGLLEDQGLVSRLEVSEQSSTARFVGPDVPLSDLELQAVQKSSGFGSHAKLFAQVPEKEAVVAVVLEDGKIAALITSEKAFDPAALEAAIDDAVPASRTAKPVSVSTEKPQDDGTPRVVVKLRTGESASGTPIALPGAGITLFASGLLGATEGGQPVKVEVDGRVVVKEAVVEKDGTVSLQLSFQEPLSFGSHTVRVVQGGPAGERSGSEAFLVTTRDRPSLQQ